MNRLERLNPFPNEANLRKMTAQAKDYATELNKLKEELKTRVLPVPPMAPNEFQSQLRQAIVSLGEKARANKVKLPENFFLGFEEFASALPDTAAAPVLGPATGAGGIARQHRHRCAHRCLDQFPSASPRWKRRRLHRRQRRRDVRRRRRMLTAGQPLVERTVFDVAFTATPSAARRVLDQVASINQQFFIVRTIHVLNDKDKGPTA